jgi:hypothetical protein
MALLIILIRAEILDIGGASPSHFVEEKSIFKHFGHNGLSMKRINGECL